MAWRSRWTSLLVPVLFVLAPSCADDTGDTGDTGSTVGDGCDCKALMPVCGVDEMTYNAGCGEECVPVEIECTGECPCNASSDTTTAASSGEASGSGEASESGGAETTMGIDPCDCPLGAYVPACGVDGMTYDATCGNECVPVEIACMAECPCPTLVCGEAECGAAMPVCTEVSGGAEPTVSYSCGVLPETCAAVEDPSCECVEPGGGCECVEGPENYFYVSCAAP
jgi:hypothetical protein